MKKVNYSVLVHRELTGEITSDESTILQNWLAEDKNNSIFAEDIRGIWIVSQSKVSGWEPDVEGSLKKLQQRIAEDGQTKTTRQPVIFSLMKYAAAAVFILSIGYFVSGIGANSADLNWQVAETNTKEVKALTLADGSQVTLNEGTYFTFPENFGSDSRVVKMEGEGFFQIAREEDRPFSIEMDHGTVRVLGTSFNIENDPAANTTTISVASGKVAFVPTGSSQEIILEVNDKLIFNDKTKRYRQVRDLSPNEWSWKTNELVFKDTKLEEVIPAIEKHFDIQLSVANARLVNCRNLTATFTEVAKMDVLTALTLTLGGEIKKSKTPDTFVIFGGVCE